MENEALMFWSSYLKCENKDGYGPKNSFGIKRIAIQANGQIVSVMLGKDFCNSTKVKNSICTKNP